MKSSNLQLRISGPAWSNSVTVWNGSAHPEHAALAERMHTLAESITDLGEEETLKCRAGLYISCTDCIYCILKLHCWVQRWKHVKIQINSFHGRIPRTRMKAVNQNLTWMLKSRKIKWIDVVLIMSVNFKFINILLIMQYK